MASIEWRHFTWREIHKAFVHADRGGVAVHDTGFKYRGRETTHLFAQDHEKLMRAAREVGVELKWLQLNHGREHFDLFGRPMQKALEMCRQSTPEASER